MFSGRGFLTFFITTSIVVLLVSKFFLGPKSEQFIVQAPCGKIVGTYGTTSISQRKISRFTGIPYAKPPIGPLRFQRPESPEDGKEEVINSVSKPPMCTQLAFPGGGLDGQEDCLYLNVFAPKYSNAITKSTVRAKSKLPVMVFIHGGGLILGEGYTYSPGYLLERDVVLVHFNYRLGPFGFLNLRKDNDGLNLPAGNQGLWDQNLALHWVKRNIASFGGDPDKITVFGESAGGWSVNYQLVSDQSKGLFNAAIIQSGPLLASYQEPAYSGKTTKEIHQKYAEQIGCGPGKEDTVVACLRSKTPEEIIKLMFIMHEKEECSIGSLGPKRAPRPSPWIGTIDSSLGENAFFKKSPSQLSINSELSSQVPIIIGTNSGEGLVATGKSLADKTLIEPAFGKNSWDECAPLYMVDYRPNKSHKRALDMANIMKAHYIGEGEYFNADKSISELTTMVGDADFIYGSYHSVNAWSKNLNKPIYYYLFEHIGEFSFGDLFAMDGAWDLLKMAGQMVVGSFKSKTTHMGAAHADDLLYLFGMPFDFLPDFLLPQSKQDLKLRRLMVDLWANFAATHKPIPTKEELKAVGIEVEDLLSGEELWKLRWDPVKSGKDYIRFSEGTILNEANSDFNRRMKFWDDYFAS